MFHWIIVLLFIVSSLFCNFNRCAICFSRSLNIACPRVLKMPRVKPFWIKNNIINSLACWGVTLLMLIQTLDPQLALQKREPAGRIRDFGNFFNGFAKSPRVLRSSWILNECNLYCKIVKYCILSKVCMIKTVPHSTVSPQMWCINGIKGWFTRTQICWQDFAK